MIFVPALLVSAVKAVTTTVAVKSFVAGATAASVVRTNSGKKKG